jgi:hypothetical protein
MPISNEICTIAHALNCQETLAFPKKKYDVLNISPSNHEIITDGRNPETLLVR